LFHNSAPAISKFPGVLELVEFVRSKVQNFKSSNETREIWSVWNDLKNLSGILRVSQFDVARMPSQRLPGLSEQPAFVRRAWFVQAGMPTRRRTFSWLSGDIPRSS
jgi:hypothetical protein